MSSTRPKTKSTKTKSSPQAEDPSYMGTSRPRTSGSRAQPSSSRTPRQGKQSSVGAAEAMHFQPARMQPKPAARAGTKALVPRGSRNASGPLAVLTNPDKRIVMKKHNGLLHPEGTFLASG